MNWALERQALNLLGYSAPLPLSEPDRAKAVLEVNKQAGLYSKNLHVSSPEVGHLLNDPGLLMAVERLCGTQFKLWRSALFRKAEGSGEITWHHDKHFYSDDAEDIRLSEMGAHYSVLFGLTDVTQTTGMMEFIPGSHQDIEGFDRDTRPFHKRPADKHLIELPLDVAARARPLPIPAGCFVIFHSAVLHRSLEHTNGADRLGLAIRIVQDDLAIPAELAEPGDVFRFPPPI